MDTRRRGWLAAVAALGVITALLPLTRATAAEPILERVAGTIGEGPATDVAQRPVGIAVHGNTLYVADEHDTNVVRALDLTTGRERIVAGDGIGPRLDNVPATSTMITVKGGIATDAAGNLFITEYGIVRKLDAATGILSTVAGQFVAKPIDGGGNGDGGPATNARLDPDDVAVDALGNLYVVDNYSHRVRKVDILGTITTIAGTGTAGFSGDGGPATQAQLNNPKGVALDAAGNVYIADNDNFRVRKVDTLGTITTFAGNGVEGTQGDGGPATQASLADPRDIAFDSDGNAYIADAYGYRLRKVDRTGEITTFAGNGQWGSRGDGGSALLAQVLAFDVTFDGAGNLYFADSWLNKVRRIDRQRVITSVAGNGYQHYRGDGGPALDAQLHRTPRLAVDPETNGLLLADSWDYRLRAVDSHGVITTVLDGTADYRYFYSVAFDPWGNRYVSEAARILRYDRNGNATVVAGKGSYGYSGDGGLAVDAQVWSATSLAFDAAGNLYFVDQGNQRVRKVSTLGIISTVAGTGTRGHSGDGGQATQAMINVGGESGLAVDGAGNLWLADTYNDALRKIDPAGNITSPYDLRVALKSPAGLTFDGAGNLFVVSARENVVRRVTPGGTWTTVAGNGQAGYEGEGGPAVNAQLAVWGNQQGGDVEVDANGTLYISGHQRVWKVDGVAVPVTFPTPPSTTTSTTSTSTSTSTTTTSTTLPPRTVAWGLNHAGQAGLAVADWPEPRAVLGNPENQTAVAAGWFHSLAVNGDGTVAAWGWNQFGQVGNGTVDTQLAPVAVAGLTGVRAVAAGVAHSLAVKSDGTVWAWGLNMFGQLGDGTVVDRRTPVQVPGLTGVVAVAAGAYHSLALKSDGTVWAWGWNGKGGVGDGTLVERHSPVPVTGLPAVSAIAAGGYHSLAVVADGTVRSWGWNPVGQLGTGSTVDSAVPVAVPGLGGVAKVAAGLYHSVALRTDGTVRAWGWNAFGQVGDGTTTDRPSPVTAAGVAGATAVAAGFGHTVAALGDGRALAWGWNTWGQLGVGAGGDPVYALPTPLYTAVRLDAVAAGATHTVAIGRLT